MRRDGHEQIWNLIFLSSWLIQEPNKLKESLMTAKIRTKTTTVQRYTRANVMYKPQPNKLQVVIQTRDV